MKYLVLIKIYGFYFKKRTEIGFTAVLVTRDVSEAVRLADRVIILDDNNITIDLQITLPRPRIKDNDADFFEQYILNKLMEKEKVQVEPPKLDYVI